MHSYRDKDEALSRSECFWAGYSLLRGKIDSFRVHSFFRLTASCATFPPSRPPDTTTGGFTTKQTFHLLFTKAMCMLAQSYFTKAIPVLMKVLLWLKRKLHGKWLFFIIELSWYIQVGRLLTSRLPKNDSIVG